MHLLRLKWKETGRQQVKLSQKIYKYLETEQHAAERKIGYRRYQEKKNVKSLMSYTKCIKSCGTQPRQCEKENSLQSVPVSRSTEKH